MFGIIALGSEGIKVTAGTDDYENPIMQRQTYYPLVAVVLVALLIFYSLIFYVLRSR